MKLTTHLPLMPRLRMGGVILLPPYTFKARTGKNLPSYLHVVFFYTDISEQQFYFLLYVWTNGIAPIEISAGTICDIQPYAEKIFSNMNCSTVRNEMQCFHKYVDGRVQCRQCSSHTDYCIGNKNSQNRVSLCREQTG